MFHLIAALCSRTDRLSGARRGWAQPVTRCLLAAAPSQCSSIAIRLLHRPVSPQRCRSHATCTAVRLAQPRQHRPIGRKYTWI